MYEPWRRAELAECLARAFLAGAWEERELVARADLALDSSARWAPRVARDVLAAYHRAPRDRPRELAAFIDLALAWRRRFAGEERPPRPRRWLVYEPAMGRRPWPVPEIASVGALARLFGLTPGELAWFADARSLERSAPDERLRNYRYAARPRGQALPRVLEAPKARLKQVQQQLLHDVLDWIPAHDTAHGFTRGRSALTHAGRHVDRAAVLTLDLEDFFASIAAGRVYGIFRSAGYPESVAHALTSLTTNSVPAGVLRRMLGSPVPGAPDGRFRLGRQLAQPHLPQGAPTSPALANLAAFGLDRRLQGLAQALGCAYSRYADDITLSGSLRSARDVERLRATVAEIASEEGFAINERKSRLSTRAGRQTVCGLVVNAHANVPRREYDLLRATIHNAARHGPDSQNRAKVRDFRAHLLGRISWVEQANPARGRRLRRAFATIDWGGPPRVATPSDVS